jgi:hypothetical protein
MKAELIPQLPPHRKSFFNSARCSRKLTYPGNTVERCRRFATHRLDGVDLCKQHAGELALAHYMKKGE